MWRSSVNAISLTLTSKPRKRLAMVAVFEVLPLGNHQRELAPN